VLGLASFETWKFNPTDFDQVDGFLMPDEFSLCFLPVFGPKRSFEFLAAESKADVMISGRISLQPSHVTPRWICI